MADVAAGTLTGFGETVAAVFGKGGSLPAADKREGDGATPLGIWPVRTVLLRPDRVAGVVTRLPWRWLRVDDGWSDGVGDPAYNRPVRHLHGFSAERLWRDDHVYDLIVVLGHNEAPVVAGAGSAIFLHCTRPDRAATEGCIAVEKGDLERFVGMMAAGDSVTLV
nr:L,D-transpeptidase family protein [Polymorphobacter glacialis]